MVHSNRVLASATFLGRAAAGLALLAGVCASEARGQVAADYAVQVSATVQASPPRITLAWPAFAGATSYTIYRKSYAAGAWGSPVATLPGTATSYPDAAVAVGTPYEYQVLRAGGVTGYGYVASGIDLPLVENRGKVELIVDSTYAASLQAELSRLADDLVGDGWTVLRHDVSRTAAVPSVKGLIHADYAADPSGVKAVLLFGHVPVPYSGDIAPDGHGNHIGAWPADMYYADMDGAWTDTMDLTPGATGRQSNHPADGKFDQSYAPSVLELQVGRVDLADMPAFAPKTELDLLRQYLNKDHNFRHKVVTAQGRGLIDDNFGAFGGEAFASSGWRAFSAFFGAANVSALDWFTTLSSQSYLWAYGCGGGNFTGAGGVGSTSNFVSTDTKTVFTMLFGSYFGDWDTQNNFLRAPLATTTYGLTCAWAGRPPWYFHHMGMGETIGYSALVTQNNNGLYWYSWNRSIHIALMGDSTLRLQPAAPVSGLTATPVAGAVRLDWTASPDAGLGYNIYRSGSPAGPFTRLNASLVSATTFTDGAPPSGAVYMVRAVRLETSGTGTYRNASQGITVSYAPNPPVLTSIAPTSGPASGGTTVSAVGSAFVATPTVRLGSTAAGSVTLVDAAHLHFAAPSLPAGTLQDVTVTNPDLGSATLPKAWLADFLDVPQANMFHPFVEKLIRDGVSNGCGGGNFCPSSSITRAQMAVFLLRSEHGPAYAPPPATGTVFADVPAGAFAASWIERLYAEGVTGGCGTNPLRFCPNDSVSRAQMAVLLLRGEHGSSYTPPPATGTVFADVPASAFAAAWIERLYAEGISGGCGTNPLRYCPGASITRGQMAVFLVSTFGLP